MMSNTPHEFVPGVIFHNRCKECGVPFEYHSFPSEPEKPIDENCTCWSPDGGHDGDCAIWGDRSWPPKMETKVDGVVRAADLTVDSLKANIGDERIKGLVDDSGRVVFPAVTTMPETMNVNLHTTIESGQTYPPPSAETMDYPMASHTTSAPVTHAPGDHIQIDVTKVCTCWPSGHPGHDGDCHIWGRMND